MYSLIPFCKGENESDLQSILYPISTPLVSEDADPDVLMAMSRGDKAGNLIGMLGSLPGGIGTLVDVTQLLITMQKALDSPVSDDDKCGTTSADADGTNASQQSGILGPPPLMSCKPSIRVSLKGCSQFAFNHVLASHIQVQLIQKLTMPPVDEPVPMEARLPISSLGGVVSLFDLPLVRPLIAKSSLKSAAEQSTASSKSNTQLVVASSAPVAATGGSILGQPPAFFPRFQPPQKNAAAPLAPGGNFAPPRGPPIRPLMGRNFAGVGDWPRPRGGSRPALMHQSGEPTQLTGGLRGHGNSKPGVGWQWNDEMTGDFYEGHHWDSVPEPVESDWNTYSRQPSMKPKPTGRNPVGVPPRPPVRPPVDQSSFPNARGKPPQVC